MYLYQENQTYFAQVAEDIKPLAIVELESLGATNLRPRFRGIAFTATTAVLYAINYNSRLVNRVLAPILYFNCHSDKYLYRRASELHWEDFLSNTNTFAVTATVAQSAIKHSKFAALRLKDAIADYFRARTNQRPSVDTREPDLWINLHIENNQATISIDTSGGSLHRRGYRLNSVAAPMIETLAAALISQIEWDKQTPITDPFCGSGTLLCEAYLQATGTPAGSLRKRFGLEQLPDFDPELWQQMKSDYHERIQSVSHNLISGSDCSATAVEAARKNCALISPGKDIAIKEQDVFDIPAINDKIIISNPPYGIRLENSNDLGKFYRRFGDFLKQRCSGSTAYIYFGDRQYIKKIGLHPSWKKAFNNGGLDGRLAKYVLY